MRPKVLFLKYDIFMILLNTSYNPFLEVRDGSIQDSLAEM